MLGIGLLVVLAGAFVALRRPDAPETRALFAVCLSLGLAAITGPDQYSPCWFVPLFFLSAAVDSGVGNGGINYALEIVPEGERPTYVGLMNTLLAAALGLAALAGGLRDIVGYQGLYTLTLVVALASLGMILRLPEPRGRRS